MASQPDIVDVEDDGSLQPESNAIDLDAEPPSPEFLCNMCPRLGVGEICLGCISSNYCSAKCRQKDWPSHRLVCLQWGSMTPADRPGDHFRRVLVFPVQREEPYFTWMNINNRTIRGGGQILNLDTRGDNLTIDKCLHNVNIGHSINISVQGKLYHKHPMAGFNKSIATILKPGLGRSWYGVVVFWAFRLSENLEQEVYDISMRDFRHVVDFFQMCPLNSCVIDRERFIGRTVPGLRIACDVESTWNPNHRSRSTSLRYMQEEAMIVPVVVAVKTVLKQYPCGRAQRLGLQWFIREDVTCRDWLDDHTKPDAQVLTGDELEPFLVNERARFLANHLVHQGCNCRPGRRPAAECQLWTLPEPGTVIVVHARGAELHPLHIVAFNEFYQERDHPRTPEAFKAYWELFKADCKRPGYEVELQYIPSPYDFETAQLGPYLLPMDLLRFPLL